MRKSNSKSGIAAVAIFVILLAAGLVSIGYLTLSPLFDSCGCVRTVTISSAALYSGKTASNQTTATSKFEITLNNPGTATYIMSIVLTGNRSVPSVTYWSTTPSFDHTVVLDEIGTSKSISANETVDVGIMVQQAITKGNPANLLPTGTSTYTFYPVTNNGSISLQSSQIFDFVLNFAFGQSVSGSLTAQ
jgi:hypothetical protein